MHSRNVSRWVMLSAAAVVLLPQAALAHPGNAIEGGALAAGLLHPLTGADHLLAMVASGLLAVRIGTRRALWAVPCAFVSLMLVGSVFGAAGAPLPHGEWMISASVIALGLVVALAPRVPLRVGLGIVGAAARSRA